MSAINCCTYLIARRSRIQLHAAKRLALPSGDALDFDDDPEVESEYYERYGGEDEHLGDPRPYGPHGEGTALHHFRSWKAATVVELPEIAVYGRETQRHCRQREYNQTCRQ